MNYRFSLEPPHFRYRYQDYFTEYAISEAIKLLEKAGYTREVARWMVTSGGIRIHTTLDPHIQEILDETYADEKNFQRDPSIYVNWPETPQSSAIVIDNATGAVIGLTGGVGRKTANLITNAQRMSGGNLVQQSSHWRSMPLLSIWASLQGQRSLKIRKSI